MAETERMASLLHASFRANGNSRSLRLRDFLVAYKGHFQPVLKLCLCTGCVYTPATGHEYIWSGRGGRHCCLNGHYQWLHLSGFIAKLAVMVLPIQC